MPITTGILKGDGLRIRPCGDEDGDRVLAIVNRAAEAYRGHIPDDCWHEPYMSRAAFEAEIAGGARFVGIEADGTLVGVMAAQKVRNVELIRHAYVLPVFQGQGIGAALLAELRARAERQVMVGTWAGATWAIAFYEHHGFVRLPPAVEPLVLRTYWAVPPRQIEVSVALASPGIGEAEARALVAEAL